MFTTVNHSLRLPTFTELYYRGPTNLGNPDLKPETATSFEAGTKFANDDYLLSTSFFSRFGKNIIDWARKSDTLLWESKNITELNSFGFEITLTNSSPVKLTDKINFFSSSQIITLY